MIWPSHTAVASPLYLDVVSLSFFQEPRHGDSQTCCVALRVTHYEGLAGHVALPDMTQGASSNKADKVLMKDSQGLASISVFCSSFVYLVLAQN